MIYESTGEVRVPRTGEYFLGNDPAVTTERNVHLCDEDSGYEPVTPRVIMRPMIESEHTDHELLLQAKAIADGTTSMLGTTAHVKALFAMARKLANGYYPIAHSVDPQFMRAHARDMIEYMKGHDADL